MNNDVLVFSEGDLLRLSENDYCELIQIHDDFHYESKEMLLFDRYIDVLRYLKRLEAEKELLERYNFLKEIIK